MVHLISAVVMRGIKSTAQVQWFMSGIEILLLLIVGIADVPSLNAVTDSVGIGLIAVGIIPLAYGRLRKHAAFYQLPKESYLPADGVHTVAYSGGEAQ